MDILDLPLYGNVSHEILTLNSSQFKDTTFYIPTISKNDVLHGQQLEILDSSATGSDQSDTEQCQNSGVRECDNMSLYGSDSAEVNTGQAVCRSKRVHKPTLRFL